MAKHASLIMGQMTGKLGDAVFSVRKGVQEVRKYSRTNSSNGNGATKSQRMTRLRLASLAGMYQILKPFMQYAFQSKSNLISDYNAFVKANASTNVIMFTKSEVSMGSQCVGPVIIANGTLPEIVCSLNDDFNYVIGLKAVISEGMTVGQFAQEIVRNNEGWQYGDKLTIALIKNGARETINGSVYTSAAKFYTITLDTQNSASLASVAPSLKSDVQGVIYLDDVQNQLATSIAACHSRKDGSKLLVSPAFVCCEKDDAVAIINSTAHIDAAMDSYGYKDDALLEPSYVEENVPVEDISRIQKVLVNGEEVPTGASLTITEPATLEIRGVNLVGALRVGMGTDVWTPVSIESKIAQYTVSQSGTIRIVCGSQNITINFTYEPETEVLVEAVLVNGQGIRIGDNYVATSSPTAIAVTGEGYTGLTVSSIQTTAGTVNNFKVVSDSNLTFNLSTTEGQTAIVKLNGEVIAVIKHEAEPVMQL